MSSTDVSLEELEAVIRNVPDFPQEGIQFKDIRSLERGTSEAGAIAVRSNDAASRLL